MSGLPSVCASLRHRIRSLQERGEDKKYYAQRQRSLAAKAIYQI